MVFAGAQAAVCSAALALVGTGRWHLAVALRTRAHSAVTGGQGQDLVCRTEASSVGGGSAPGGTPCMLPFFYRGTMPS